MKFCTITNATQHEAALKRIDQLFHARPGTPEAEECDSMIQSVEAYEAENYPIAQPSPVAAIRFRSEQQIAREGG